jgi:hypothetical protein
MRLNEHGVARSWVAERSNGDGGFWLDVTHRGSNANAVLDSWKRNAGGETENTRTAMPLIGAAYVVIQVAERCAFTPTQVGRSRDGK